MASKIIGNGAFGDVYEEERDVKKNVAGKLTLVKCKVAVKKLRMLNHTDLPDPQIEAYLLGLISHKNVVEIFSHSSEEIVMELATGGSVMKKLHDFDTPLNTEDVILWCSDIATGIKHLHYDCHQTMLHRDLKSDNVLIFNDLPGETRPIAKIADFGLAHSYAQSMVMSRYGTIEWMAPEVLNGYNWSKAGDVWSYGIIIWEILTRKVPWRDFFKKAGNNRYAAYYKIAVEKLYPAIPLNAPPFFAELIKQCCKPDPLQRITAKDIYRKWIDYKEGDKLEQLAQDLREFWQPMSHLQRDASIVAPPELNNDEIKGIEILDTYFGKVESGFRRLIGFWLEEIERKNLFHSLKTLLIDMKIVRSNLDNIKRPEELFKILLKEKRLSEKKVGLLTELAERLRCDDLIQQSKGFQEITERSSLIPAVGDMNMFTLTSESSNNNMLDDILGSYNPDDKYIRRLEREIDYLVPLLSSNWRRVARWLYVPDAIIDDIEDQRSYNYLERAERCMHEWIKNDKEKATREALIRALRNAQLNLYAHAISKLPVSDVSV